MFFLRYSCHRNNPNKWNRGRTSRHDPYFYQDMQMQGRTLPMGLQNNPHHMTPAHMMYAYPPARYNAIQWQQGCPYSYHYPNSTSCADNIEYEVCFLIKGVTSFFKKVFGIDKKKELFEPSPQRNQSVCYPEPERHHPHQFQYNDIAPGPPIGSLIPSIYNKPNSYIYIQQVYSNFII
jgi:hypothetical protein